GASAGSCCDDASADIGVWAVRRSSPSVRKGRAQTCRRDRSTTLGTASDNPTTTTTRNLERSTNSNEQPTRHHRQRWWQNGHRKLGAIIARSNTTNDCLSKQGELRTPLLQPLCDDRDDY